MCVLSERHLSHIVGCESDTCIALRYIWMCLLYDGDYIHEICITGYLKELCIICIWNFCINVKTYFSRIFANTERIFVFHIGSKEKFEKRNILVLKCCTRPLNKRGYLHKLGEQSESFQGRVEVRIGSLPPTPHECVQGYGHKAHKNEFQTQENKFWKARKSCQVIFCIAWKNILWDIILYLLGVNSHNLCCRYCR